VLRRILAEGRMSAPVPNDHPAQVLAAYLLLTLRHEVLVQRVLTEEAQKATDTLRQVFPPPFVARLRALMDEVPGLNSTAETVDLARRIRRLIEDEADQRSENGPGGTSGAEDKDTTTQESDADSDQGNTESSREESTGRPGTNSEKTGKDAESQAADAATDRAQDGGPDGSGSQPDDCNDTDSPDTSDLDPGATVVSAGDADGSYQHDALTAVLAAGAGDCDGDLFNEVGKLLSTDASATNAIRLPLPEDYTGNALAGMRLLVRVSRVSEGISWDSDQIR
jgi:hypothetical protein